MMARQREMLATLGIDVWIPRARITQKNTATNLWRDQLANDISSQPITFEEQPHEAEIQLASEQLHSIETKAPKVDFEIDDHFPVVEKQLEKEHFEKEQLIVTATIQSFELQMYVMENCVILLESSQLDAAQQKLWRHIQLAKAGQFTELQWPFPLADFQENRGLASYIQGFLDAHAIQKKILCLGELNFIQHSNIINLSSLEDMLAQPLLKKQLWQLMQ
ncbi:MAG: hypothetical protein RSA22_03780 [Acinetobacter sp.]|jgi:hypothetical protein